MKKSVMFFKFSALLLGFALVFTSCDDEEPVGAYSDGAFITNEGGFGNSNGSVSFYSYGANTVTNNIFSLVNDRTLGDVVQSLTINGDKAYIAVNGSNKVEIVDKNTFKSIQTIEEVPSPRYIATSGSKAYVSCWGDNSVKAIDLNSYTFSKSIAVGSGPEKMTIANNKLYVVNSGGWGADSLVSVIDLETEEVIASVTVKYSPRDIEVDAEGNLWVLCYGKVVYDPETWALVEQTPSMIYKINGNSNSVVASIELFADQHPTTLDINNDGSTLYFGGGFGFGGIYSLVINGSTATYNKIIEDYAYGFSYDSNTDKIFVTVAQDFTNAGELIRYETNGTKLDTYTVGIGPNGVSFKNAK
jgi:YVTN family beta-propeller protein